MEALGLHPLFGIELRKVANPRALGRFFACSTREDIVPFLMPGEDGNQARHAAERFLKERGLSISGLHCRLFRRSRRALVAMSAR